MYQRELISENSRYVKRTSSKHLSTLQQHISKVYHYASNFTYNRKISFTCFYLFFYSYCNDTTWGNYNAAQIIKLKLYEGLLSNWCTVFVHIAQSIQILQTGMRYMNWNAACSLFQKYNVKPSNSLRKSTYPCCSSMLHAFFFNIHQSCEHGKETFFNVLFLTNAW